MLGKKPFETFIAPAEIASGPMVEYGGKQLGMLMTSWQATTFLVGEYFNETDANPVFTVADGLIWLRQSVQRNSMVRKLEILKMRGQPTLPGLHTFRIDDTGIRVFAPAKTVAAVKPIKTAFNKTSLVTHLAEMAAVEVKAVKAVIASLEATIMASVHKKGLGSFTLPGLLKVNVVNVPAKKKRTGIDPFTKQERVFAAKPATVKIKTRALKKLKDAAS